MLPVKHIYQQLLFPDLLVVKCLLKHQETKSFAVLIQMLVYNWKKSDPPYSWLSKGLGNKYFSDSQQKLSEKPSSLPFSFIMTHLMTTDSLI